MSAADAEHQQIVQIMLTQSSACHASASSVALVFQGAGVADTIRSGITNIEFFTPRPDILAYGACK
jgi:hypothetical protein